MPGQALFQYTGEDGQLHGIASDDVNDYLRDASGAEFTTGNARLSKYVIEQARAAGVPVPAIEGFQRAMERAMGGPISDAAKASENFVKKNEAAPTESQVQQSPPAPAPSVPAPATAAASARLEGYVMEEKDRSKTVAAKPSLASTSQWAAGGVTVPILAGLIFWRWRRQRDLRNQDLAA